MPELKLVVKKNTLSPNMKVTAFQLTPEEYADDKWHGAGIGNGEEGLTEEAFLKTLRKLSKNASPPEPGV